MSAGWKKLVLNGIIMPAAVLLMMEYGLRMVGFGVAPRLLLPHKLFGKDVLVMNMKAGAVHLGEAFGRGPLFQVLAKQKPANGLRVVVLGESAVKGELYSSVSFPAQLQVVLQDVYSNRVVEVLNAGMPAINSWAVRSFARECLSYKPDIFILYTGNNEFIGPYGAGARGWLAYWRPVIRVQLWLRGLRLYQLAQRIAEWGRPCATPWEGMAACAQRTTAPDDPSLARVLSNYERNMRGLVRLARRAGVQVVVCTLAAQERGWAPFASRTRSTLRGETLTAWSNAFVGEDYEEALALDDGYAEAAYQYANTLAQRGEHMQAARWYGHARDVDALKFRPVRGQNRMLRELAQAQQAVLVDVADMIEQRARPAGTLEDVLYDHVHFKAWGNYLVASNVAVAIMQRYEGAENRAVTPFHDCMACLGFTLPDEWDALEQMERFLQQYPFRGQSDHSQRIARVRAEHAALGAVVTAAGLTGAIAVSEAAVVRWPGSAAARDKLGQAYAAAHRYGDAAQQFQYATQLEPWRVDTWARLAQLLYSHGRAADAVKMLTLAIENGIQLPQTYCTLAAAQLAAGDVEHAERAAQRAIRLDRMSADGWFMLGCVRQQRGDHAGATNAWERALTLQAFHAPALQALGRRE